MRKIYLLSSILLSSPFVMSGVTQAQCTTAPDCTTLGYSATSNTGNCLKCPTGNYYFCPEKIEESCQTKKRTIYGNCKIQYLVGYAIFCQKGYYYCQVQSSGSCQEITGSRTYGTDFLDFGAYPDQTKAQERIRQLQKEIVNEICESYNGNGGSSSGGGSGGTTTPVCKIRTFAKYENCKFQAITNLSGNIMCQRCTYKEQRQSKNSTQWNQISRQCNSNFEKENYISATDKEALDNYIPTVLEKDEGSNVPGSSSCVEYYS